MYTKSVRSTEINVEGPATLRGEIAVSGSKNAALAQLAGAALSGGQVVLENVPQLDDVASFCNILNSIGVSCSRVGSTVLVSAGSVRNDAVIGTDLSSRTRASVYCLGIFSALRLRGRVGLPGGDGFSARPIDFHIEALRRFGVVVEFNSEFAIVSPRDLRGTRVPLPFPSVTGTCNCVMVALHAVGETRIVNAARDPEVQAFCRFLTRMGARIGGIGTSELVVDGPTELRPNHVVVEPDRSEIVTLAIAAGLTRGDVLIRFDGAFGLSRLVKVLERVGIAIRSESDGLRVSSEGPFCAFQFECGPYPRLQSDWQPIATALATGCAGRSWISDEAFPNRRTHLEPLRVLGAKIHEKRTGFLVDGPTKLKGAIVTATDIRCAAALLVAGLAADGVATVNNAWQLDRGYEHIDQKLQQLGARIWLS